MVPAQVLEWLACDFTTVRINGLARKMFVGVDLLSGFLFASLVANETKDEAVRCLREMMMAWSATGRVHADNGAAFRSRDWLAVVDRYARGATFSTAYHPQGNGLCERANQTLVRMMRTAQSDRDGAPLPAEVLLTDAVMAFNAAVSTVTGFAPRDVMFELQPGARAKAVEARATAVAKRKAAAEAAAAAAPTVGVVTAGMLVTLRWHARPHKGSDYFLGPYRVERVRGNGTNLELGQVREPTADEVAGGADPYDLIVVKTRQAHVSHCRPWHGAFVKPNRPLPGGREPGGGVDRRRLRGGKERADYDDVDSDDDGEVGGPDRDRTSADVAGEVGGPDWDRTSAPAASVSGSAAGEAGEVGGPDWDRTSAPAAASTSGSAEDAYDRQASVDIGPGFARWAGGGPLPDAGIVIGNDDLFLWKNLDDNDEEPAPLPGFVQQGSD